MDSTITVRFYRVDRTNSKQKSFENCLIKILKIKSDEDREVIAGDAKIESTANAVTGDFYVGDLVRLQNENLPSLKITGKDPQSLKLPDGGHLGHHTAYMYNSKSRMLAFQMARSSVSMSRFNLYIDKLCSSGLYDFLPVIKPDELKQLVNMQPKTFLIKVADPDDLDAVSDDQVELQNGLKSLQKVVKGAYVKVQIGMGHYSHALDKGVVSKTIGWLLEQHAKNRGGVKTIQLKGTTLDGTGADPLNFLKAHVDYAENLQVGLLSPRQSLSSRIGILSRAFAEQSAVLKGFECKEF